MTRPTLSVIVPIHDSALHLERCLESLLAQSVPGLEIILVDDASGDASPRICGQYAAQYPDIVRFAALPCRQGPGAARNAGMALAQGEWLGFVDSDDVALPEMYAELHACAQRADADIVVCGLCLESEQASREIVPRTDGNLQASRLLLHRKLQPSVCNKLFRKAFVDAARVRFPASYCAEDMAFVFLLLTENPRVHAVAKALYVYHCKPTSLSADMARRKSVLESLRHIKQRLMARGSWRAYRHAYARIFFLHALYYPLQLCLVRSLLRGENRWANLTNFPAYLRACCGHLRGD